MDFARKLLFAALVACSYAANEPGLVALTDYDCGCPGQNTSFICTAVGGVITVWEGSAFNCPDRNEISLRHSQFENAIGPCNGGAIVGYGVESMNNCFTSRLDVTLSDDLQGRTITCSVDDGSGPATGVTSLGTEMLIVSTPSAPPPAPEGLTALIVTNELIFRWGQLDPNDYNCSTLQYDFTSENCGSCAVVTPQVVSCSGFQISTAGITCTFIVWSVVCGNVTGPGSMRSIDISLKVPDAPTVKTLPRYQDGRVQILIGLMTTFATVAPTFISDGIDGSIRNYTITYFDSTFRSTCGTASIPASSCVSRMCTHSFDILRSSSCPPSTTIIVSVAASNVLGSGPQSAPLIREGINNLVNVNFDPNRRTITCTFLNQLSNIMKVCSANITYGANCERFLNTFIGMDTGESVETQPLEAVSGVVDYCFLVTAKSNNVTVLVDGNLQNLPMDSSDMTAAIVVPIIITLLLLSIFIIVAVTVSFVVKHFWVTKSNIRFKFSVKNKPGSLAKALKVFKDCKVNILGLNTHLHHADFDRNAGNGYKFNYVHCMCTRKDKEFLEKKLEAQFEGGDQQGDDGNEEAQVTAIIKVKDSPGALWKALHTIGEEGINIVGVNTLTDDRETYPGYKDNYVICYCSEGSLHRVHTELKTITGKEVEFKFLDEEPDSEEKLIQYLVKDEVGALGRTLQVISDVGINISGVNLDHLPTNIRRTIRAGGLKINFIECSIERSAKKDLFDKLLEEYGAVAVQDHEVPQNKLERDSNYAIVKVTGQNEKGSLNRILKAFRDFELNIYGVNILDPAFVREEKIPYKHYHLEITATNDQEADLKERLLAGGFAIDIRPFKLPGEADKDSDVQSLQSHDESEVESDSGVEAGAGPTTRRIQFYVRDEVGSLANALKVFGELAINITKVNPAHLSPEHQVEFVECSCAESQRESLIEKLKSYGAIKAEVLPEKKVQRDKLIADACYCIIKFSVGSEAGSIFKVLKAFPDTGVNKIYKINPPHIKVYNQYVECCCNEEQKAQLLTKLKKIPGVTQVGLEPNSIVSVRPTEDANYCIVKYSIGDQAGTLVRALNVFFDLNLNIIGVNTLNCSFERKATFKYKHNHVVLVATDEQEEELKRKLLVKELAIDIKPYKRMWRSDNIGIQPESMGRNDIALTQV